ncbi:MAG TPA: DUF3857 domain-containing protein [Lysobacter sp.]|nr:DUF3857 domain-containing protein [Lysobacter sp.]
MKRLFLMAMLWAFALSAFAADVEHKRGDYTFFVGDAPAFVTPREIAAQWDATAPGADETVWRYWLYDEQVDHRKGVDATYTDYAYEPRSASSVGDAGRYQIEFNPEYQRLVFHSVQLRRNGAWQDRLLPDKISLARRESDFEKDMADGRVTALIVLDDVRVGDVVRIRYTIAGSNPILAGQNYDLLRTAWGTPLLDSHLRVLFDPGTDVRWRLDNGAAPPAVAKNPDGVEVRVDAHASPSVQDEDDYPTWYSPWPAVQIGPTRSWADVVDWALPLYPKADTLPADLEARIAEWKRLPDPQARLRAALRAVQDEVRYFGVEMGSSTHRPAAPSVTWTRRYGDCKDKAYLLSTILARMDITASPALVSTTRGSAMARVVPTAAAFNHVIVRALVDGRPVWMDPTMTQQGGDPRDTDLSDYGLVLPVVAGTTALAKIDAPMEANGGVTAVERFAPQDKDGSVRYDVETTYTGASASSMRRWLSNLRNDDLKRRYADYYRKRYGALDIEQAPAVTDDRERNTLKVTERYVLKNPYESEGSATRALDLYAQALDNPTDLPRTMARKGPLDTGLPGRFRHEIHFTVPNGWRPTFTDEKGRMDTDAFAYAHSVEVDGQAVTLHYDLTVMERELPGDAANTHVAEVRRMRDDLSSRLRFATAPERLDIAQRDARLKALLREVAEGGATE